MRPSPTLAALDWDSVEEHRDQRWRRGGLGISAPDTAEAFINSVGFASCLTDSRRPGPSLYVAVCGRRDAVMPRNVQKDPEASSTWLLKDELIRRGRVYYGKLARGKATFIAPRLVPHFKAIWGVPRRRERDALSDNARALLRVFRREWEVATGDLRRSARIEQRLAFTHALDELQAAMLVVPSDVIYEPTFTYLWTLTEGRFADAAATRVPKRDALREIARAYLAGAGAVRPGELARVTGLSRPDAGLGHRALVSEGFAHTPSPGVYRLVTGLDAETL